MFVHILLAPMASGGAAMWRVTESAQPVSAVAVICGLYFYHNPARPAERMSDRVEPKS
jgi:hypothetical protein